MALFFTSKPDDPDMIGALDEALATPPPRDEDREKLTTQFLVKAQPHLKNVMTAALAMPPPPADKRKKLASQMAGCGPSAKLAWDRVIMAIIVLALIFAAGVYTSHDDALKDWGKGLLHTFEVLLGGLAGLITGEAGKK